MMRMLSKINRSVKLKSKRGETLIEVLLATMIVLLASSMLVTLTTNAVNVNNTANEAAWYALIGQSQADTLSNGPASWLFERFKLSRQLDPDNPPADLPPSDFYAPFRSSSSSRFVPRDTLIRTSTETSLFRKTWDATGTTLVDDPVFKPRQPAADYGTNGDGRATNMLTSLSDVIRRGDMVTNRSNVFAVWVTIGYFEADEFVAADANGALQTKYPVLTHVNATNFNAIYPDGVVLGVERGLTDGTVTRHRKFYMIDRTIPVGFRRGGVARYHDGTNQQTAELKNYTDVIVNGADGLTLD